MAKKEKVNKIKEEQLKELQLKLESIREAQLRLGQIESQKYDVISVISTFKKDLNEYQDALQEEYGKVSINIQDGTYVDVEETE
jgi:hypothetical protein